MNDRPSLLDEIFSVYDSNREAIFAALNETGGSRATMTRGTVKFSRQRLLGNVEPKTFPRPPLPHHLVGSLPSLSSSLSVPLSLLPSRVISRPFLSLAPLVSASFAYLSLSLSLGFFRLSLFPPTRGARVDPESSSSVSLCNRFSRGLSPLLAVAVSSMEARI